MTPTLSSHHPRRGNTFSWVLGLLVVTVIAHVLILLWSQRDRQEPTETSTSAPEPAPIVVEPQGGPTPPLPDSLPPLDGPEQLPALPAPNLLAPVASIRPPVLEPLAPTPPPTLPAPEPAEPNLNINNPIARELVAASITARQRGDVGTAIAKLREAETHIPNHPRLHWEIGSALELMGLAKKAAASFQRVYDAGETEAGAYHRLAAKKLTQGLSLIANQAPIDEKIFIGNIEERRTPIKGPVEGMNLTLAVTLQTRPGVEIEDPGSDVYVVVHLVDTANGAQDELVVSDPPEQQWLDLPVNWNNGGIETLELSYKLPEYNVFRPNIDDKRAQLGYVIELYYKERLVDLIARPRRLARFSPALDAPPAIDHYQDDYDTMEGFTDPADL
ncbi:hypothetical protein [Sulfuriroseicoccus oceanibius]|uniref:Tetratricopeptide repeat protein n=1 Tax=Sulfuriroseicoccus oceanibius TaxID=2707525 RepID=A0A6B3LE55_9BACT|nr:hypothetical protein [Sulfuriroseicoccus oceanibius]QQL45660.1 hypothetical protein G3M56_003455 [Sulfuriroseicoccus oceanibius]